MNQMKLIRFSRRVISALLLASCSAALSATQITEQSQTLIENLQDQIKSTVAAVAEVEAKAGNSVKDIYLLVDLPAKHSPNMGLVLDLDSSEDSYKVLSVTPGSLAESLNINQGDLITSINKIAIDKSNKRGAFSELEASSPGDIVNIGLKQSGKETIIDAVVVGQYTPSIKLEIGSEPTQEPDKSQENNQESTTCGLISVFFNPPETKRLYSAFINKIDDRSVTRGRESFRLKPGKYTIYLHELISDPFFKRRSQISRTAKPLEIDIKKNTSYHLAAKHIRGKYFSDRNGDYWEPVVWKIRENIECEL